MSHTRHLYMGEKCRFALQNLKILVNFFKKNILTNIKKVVII